MSSIQIREAQVSDAGPITNIYNYYIRETILTFDLDEIGISDFEKKIPTIQKSYPFIVATQNNRVIGYAYASQWKTKAAYKHTAETTIYMNPDDRSKGTGLRLYNALLSSMPLYDLVTAIGGITIPNEASIKLHKKLGFHKVAEFKKVGFKFDEWIDVEYWQKHVG
ncbi:MAG: phosphinothricin acetyltransferase [Bacteroidetes bacterium]|nr:MAG: phosphinothricin acetyltransferase [Bacteroidota bacterium]